MSKKILLLDDDPALLFMMSRITERAGAIPIAVQSLDEIQKMLPEALQCSLAFLDVNLGTGEVSGIEVLRWLRGNKFQGQIHFLTGHAHDHPLVVEAAAQDSAKVFCKPIPIAIITNLIKGVVDGPKTKAASPEKLP